MLVIVASAFREAEALKIFRQQLDSTPDKQTYTRVEYSLAAWQAWTNRVKLPAKSTYAAAELQDVLFGLGTHQDVCDRETLTALIADASGLHHRDDGGKMKFFGFLMILAGVFSLGGVIFPQKKRP